MKTKKLFQMLMLIFGCSSLFAFEVHIYPNEEIILSDFNQKKLDLRVDYPGDLSKIVGIRLRNDEKSPMPIKEVLEKLNIRSRKTPTYKNNHEVYFELPDNVFVDWVKLSTKSDESFRNLFQSLNTNLIASAVSWEK